MRKVVIDGKTAEAVAVTKADESWRNYELEDGTKFRMKTIVTEVFKIPEKDPMTGVPQLLVRTMNSIVVEPEGVESRKVVQ